MTILYPYQEQAVNACWADMFHGHPIMVQMATGLGKTVTFAKLIDRYLDDLAGAGNRVLVLVHRDELARQAVATIDTVANSQPWTIGTVKAQQNDVEADIIVASVPTLANPDRLKQIANVGLIVIDESHHATSRTYRTIVEAFPGVPVVGFTATPRRSDGVSLGTVFGELVFSRDLPWAIRHGYLVDVVPYTVRVPDIDMLAPSDKLDAMVAESIAPERIGAAWQDHAYGKRTIVFTPGVQSAYTFADMFTVLGVRAEVVHGGMPDDERAAVLARLQTGETTVVCNDSVLIEGFDCPAVKCVVVAKATKSVTAFVQMVGRGARRWLGKDAPPVENQQCIVISLADAVNTLACVADLSEKPLPDNVDGKSLMQMEDEWDIGAAIFTADLREYRGPLVVERWDAIVQASTKVWKYTQDGYPFLPIGKTGDYIFACPRSEGYGIWRYMTGPRAGGIRSGAARLAVAPDLELAMRIAEDKAQDLGGDIGRLLADKDRAWRKEVPSADMQAMALRVGVPEEQVAGILASKRSGKAGRLSDLIDIVVASKLIDPMVARANGGSRK